MSAETTLVIGIGNRMRGDDAFGCMAAEKLRASLPVLEHDGEPASLIDTWQGHDKVFLVDAVSSGKAPGTVFRFDLRKQELPNDIGHASTHDFGVAEAVELARALGKLPPVIVFYGAEGKDFTTGNGLSPELLEPLEDIAQRIIAETEKDHA